MNRLNPQKAIRLLPFAFLALGLHGTPWISDSPLPENPDPFAKEAVEERYGRMPLAFEENQGQTDPSVRFLAHTGSYNLYLTPTESVMVFGPRKGKSEKEKWGKRFKPHPPARDSEILRMRLKDANPKCEVEGLGEMPGKSNYFIGKDPSRWKTHIPLFAQVRFREIYPRIDMVYYGNPGKLEYDFVIKPGGNPDQIRWSFQGDGKLRMGPKGNLEMGVGREKMELQLPAVYQEDREGRKPVRGRFVLQGAEAAFRVGDYDRTRSLVIDPTVNMVYSTYIGANNPGINNEFNGMTTDASGNTYLIETYGPGYPVTPGAYDPTPLAGYDPVLIKLNPAGNALVYATYFGGSGSGFNQDVPIAIAVDGVGSAYVTGQAASSDFPTTAGAFQSALKGTFNAFVTKFNPSATALVYSTFLGGSATDVGSGIALDGAGNAYVVGTADSPDYPVTPGAFQTTLGATAYAVFVTRLNPAGTALGYSTFLRGSVADYGLGIAVDGGGNAYVTGESESPNFPTTPGALQSTFGGIYNAFATKLNPTGTALSYSTYLGNTAGCSGLAIAVDAGLNAYVAGTTGSGFPTTAGAAETSMPSGSAAFVAKLNPAGTSLVYSTYLGGAVGGVISSIALDGAGGAYVAGQAYAAGFPVTPGALATSGSIYGNESDFWAILNPAGTNWLYVTYWGGTDQFEDETPAIALDGSGAIHVAGGTYCSDLIVTTGAYQTALSSSGEDLFAAVFTLASTPTPTPTASPTATLSITPTPTASPTMTPTPTPTPACVIQVWPDPFNPQYAHGGNLKVGCLPSGAGVFFYTVSGEFVQKTDETGGLAQWNGQNQQGVPVAPGVYYFVVQSGGNVVGRGKFLLER